MTDHTSIAGLLLAGGASSRFGAPKMAAVLAGATLAEIALIRLSKTCAACAIAGAPPPPGIPVAHLQDDPSLPRGPLTGILAGLEWAQARSAQWLAVAPCDMPLLPPDIHGSLANTAIAAKAPLAYVTTIDGPNPLCSVWSTGLATAVREELAAGHPPIWRYASQLGAVELELEDPAAALNVNEPADLERAMALSEYHWWRTAAES